MFSDLTSLFITDAINFAIHSLFQHCIEFCVKRKTIDPAVAKRNTRRFRKTYFKSDGQIHQNFSLPFNCMNYILKNPKSTQGLQKLYKTCKYFYVKFPVFIFPGCAYYKNRFYKDEKNDLIKIFHSMNTKNDESLWWFNDNLFLCSPFDHLKSKIFRCTIFELYIARITITMEEFDILVAENTIEEFCLWGNIVDTDGNNVNIDVILSKLPNLKKLQYYNESEKYSNETMKNLHLLKFKNKLEIIHLYLNGVQPDCDPRHLITFFEKNASISSKIGIYFAPSVSENFEAELRRFLDEWLLSYTHGKPDVALERKDLFG